ncbi:ubiquitin activating enzyme [Trypanosoma theileri]|uniref:NEDD8-activating enzyme E1 catalytic subunit n=1 Tax=Trypanosoma theileri TaxID=67003 RepID=A0A1X0P2L8_9TRYP|nr:ubiquitin activating enzyme [Trypanosoma theileri]ORC91177.1 ubiquitin activating enzyme [Trypanosoma theileri]
MSEVTLRSLFSMKERGLQSLVQRSPPAFPVTGYNPENNTWDEVRVLLVGAGGIGCEVLHALALSGFTDITVIDMDTIELSNLNRQFLFRETDIGRSKAEVAAAFIEGRCPGVRVRALFARVEDQSEDFYRQFHAIILALDSVSARRWMNQKIADIALWEIVEVSQDEGKYPKRRREKRITSAIPIIDTGTEGYEASCRIILLGEQSTPCIECMLELYPQQKRVPLCTLENVPRSPEHCVLYVQFRLWEEMRPGEALDTNNMEHIRWICLKAQQRKEAFGITGPDINEQFTIGVVKNVVPAVGFTNAFVGSQAVLELFKLLTGVAPSVNCFSYFNGAAESGGLTSYVTSLSANPACPVCAPRPLLLLTSEMRPHDVLVAIEEQIGFPVVGEEMNGIHASEKMDVTLRVRFEKGNEVYLIYKSNNPLKIPLYGNTIEEIFAASGYADSFIQWCDGNTSAFIVECSGMDIFIVAEALMTRCLPPA